MCDSLLSGLLGLEAGLRSQPSLAVGGPGQAGLSPHPGHCLQPPARSLPAAAHLLSNTPSCSVWASSSSKVASSSPGQGDEAHFLQDRLHLSELQSIRRRLCTPSTVLVCPVSLVTNRMFTWFRFLTQLFNGVIGAD